MTEDQARRMREIYESWTRLSPQERQELINESVRYSNRSPGCIDNPLPGKWRTPKEIKEMREEQAT